MMAGGYTGKILFVDLSTGSLRTEAPDESLYRDFLGGYGIGARILFDRQRAGADPFGPEAHLGFLTGVLTGTPALFGSRYAVVGKSPLTATWGDANSGGDFGPHLKFSGYDAVFFTGISSEPVYLVISDGAAELRSADGLWGKGSHETEESIKADLGSDARIACIGPSGEKLSLISCIINNEGRAAGRSGLGAVMGAKRLKAIAVRGNQEVPLAHAEAMKEARRKHQDQLAGPAEAFRRYGTAGGTAALIRVADTPVKNWTGGGEDDFPNGAAISDDAVISQQEKRWGCWRCPIACGGLMKAGNGKYRYRAAVHKPEYETLGSFGAMCLNDNLESIIKANDLCNSYGLDTISAGATIAFAIECYENGLITSGDTDGIELTWGNDEAIVAMTEKLARREGFGDVLADGVKVAAGKIGGGAEAFAVHIHGQEVPMHDPKSRLNYAAPYAADPTPGRHTQGNYGYRPAGGIEFPPMERGSQAGRGEANRMGSLLVHVVNAAGLCNFGYMSMDASAIPDFLTLATGWDYDIDAVLRTGERIASMRQAFNVREGVRPSDIKMHARVAGHPPLDRGPTASRVVDIDTVVKDYFAAMDWDLETGRPSR
ncbi:MAG: aldehyde ferredoxin oxidoreductase family protein, partial [Chloroflexota bacterium]